MKNQSQDAKPPNSFVASSVEPYERSAARHFLRLKKPTQNQPLMRDFPNTDIANPKGRTVREGMAQNTTPHLWLQRFVSRLRQIHAVIPRHLHGVIQFEVGHLSHGADTHVLRIDARGVELSDEIDTQAPTWVSTSAPELDALLNDAEPPKDALRVGGDISRFTSLLDLMIELPTAQSMVGTRAGEQQ